MAISALGNAKFMPTHLRGLYRWAGRVNDIGDVSGGQSTLSIRLAQTSDAAEKLWFYLTEIWWKMGVVTPQAAQLRLIDAYWPNISPGVDTFIGIPAPEESGDTYGATAPKDAILIHPIFLGQPKSFTGVDLQVETTNTDSMTVELSMRGFATQVPIDPVPFFGGAPYRVL